MPTLRVKVLSASTNVQIMEACHNAGNEHFGDGPGFIHLCGVTLESEDGIFKTFTFKAELRTGPDADKPIPGFDL